MCCLSLQFKARVNHRASQMFNWQPSSSSQHFQERCSYNNVIHMQYSQMQYTTKQLYTYSLFDHIHDHMGISPITIILALVLYTISLSSNANITVTPLWYICIQKTKYKVLKPGMWRRWSIQKCQRKQLWHVHCIKLAISTSRFFLNERSIKHKSTLQCYPGYIHYNQDTA